MNEFNDLVDIIQKTTGLILNEKQRLDIANELVRILLVTELCSDVLDELEEYCGN